MRKIFVLVLFIFYHSNLFGMNDHLRQSLDILNNANLVQMKRIRIATENLVNANSFNTDKTPYVRKIIVAENKYSKNQKAYLLKYKIKHSNLGFNIKYEPYHPFANSKGYVKYPNVVVEIEKADLMESQRSYEANLAAIEIGNSLINKTLEIIK